MSASGPGPGSDDARIDRVLDDFRAAWERGEAPCAEDYLDRLPDARPSDVQRLVYEEFVLAEEEGLEPSPQDYIERFPEHVLALARLFQVHEAIGRSALGALAEPEAHDLPVAGNEIGPYRLLKVLGEGAFARVFLAEQADLDDRLVVVKVSARISLEPRLLARAEHPNIVRVLWHGLADRETRQIIAMPFHGGATLAAVLAERRARGKRPTRGADFLADLDRVAPPEYTPRTRSRPNRELIESVSYPRAAAWVVARLAEALDFAYGKQVLHGDVKPSNVLLADDATPMLLDFNLAVAWRPRGLGGGGGVGAEAPDDAGGTLAYMAPERLRAVAEPGLAPRPTPADRHRADIYALGVVLLEMLTGRTPELTRTGVAPVSMQAMASAYFLSRQQGSRVMIRAARASVSAGLRAILDRCLCPDPAGRYARASELAEDLDLWRRDRPLAYAADDSKADRLWRWARRSRAALAVAVGGLTLAAGLAGSAFLGSSEAQRRGATRGYDQITGSRESGAFLLRRLGTGQVIEDRGDPASVARRHLEHYGVFGPANWREHDEIRHLPEFERDELHVWLTEQSLRYAHALRELPDAPDHWRRALACLDRVADAAYEPVEEERRQLRARLGADGSDSGAGPSRRPDAWAAAYLSGVAAELNPSPGRMLDARSRYESVLALRPGSFWGHYRAAAACFALQDYGPAVEHLRACVASRPNNAILRHQLAGCLYANKSYLEAEEEYSRAQELDPDYAETYLSRAFLRGVMKQIPSLLADFSHYQVLKGHRPATDPSPRLDLGAEASSLPPASRIGGDRHEEALIRYYVAKTLSDDGQHALALREVELALTADPDVIVARYLRGLLLQRLGRLGYREEFVRVAEHPRFAETLQDVRRRNMLHANHVAVQFHIAERNPAKAVALARQGLALSDRYGVMRARSHLSLAHALAASAPDLAAEARSQLDEARRLDPAMVAYEVSHEPALRDLNRVLQ